MVEVLMPELKDLGKYSDKQFKPTNGQNWGSIIIQKGLKLQANPDNIKVLFDHGQFKSLSELNLSKIKAKVQKAAAEKEIMKKVYSTWKGCKDADEFKEKISGNDKLIKDFLEIESVKEVIDECYQKYENMQWYEKIWNYLCEFFGHGIAKEIKEVVEVQWKEYTRDQLSHLVLER